MKYSDNLWSFINLITPFIVLLAAFAALITGHKTDSLLLIIISLLFRFKNHYYDKNTSRLARLGQDLEHIKKNY